MENGCAQWYNNTVIKINSRIVCIGVPGLPVRLITAARPLRYNKHSRALPCVAKGGMRLCER